MAAKETKLQIVIDAQNRTQGVFNNLTMSLDQAAASMRTIGTAGVVAFGALATGLGLSVREAMEAEAAQTRLAHILKTSRDASDDQIKALYAQAKALQRVGVVSEDSVIQAQAQLATFDLTAESIERLTPAILDYVVAEKGANASTEDLKQLTNGLAQALNGNFASLTRVGFVLDETTRELISNGTEAERTAALVQVLNSTYEGFNEAARNTAEGSLVSLKNSLADIGQTIGETLVPLLNELVAAIAPVIEKVSTWVEQNPELARNILLAALALTGLLAVLLPISLMLPGLVMAFTGLGTAFAFVTSGPGLLIIGIITALGFALVQLGKIALLVKNDWDMVWLGIKLIAAEGANSVIKTAEGMVNFVISAVNKAVEGINRVINLANKVPGIELGQIGKLDALQLEKFDTDAITASHLNPSPASSGSPTVVNMSGNTFLSEDVAEKIGDMIMSKLKLSNAL